ncbi:MAG: hypothetical protein DCC52_15180 [Chloroflexi bacterium]|nr:MAG: hypothetical protein DCC52_15180 [Chloroflexota bacterium]
MAGQKWQPPRPAQAGDGGDETEKGNKQRHAVIRFAPKKQERQRERNHAANIIARIYQDAKGRAKWSQTVQAGNVGMHDEVDIDRQRREQNDRRQRRENVPRRVRERELPRRVREREPSAVKLGR